MDFLLSFDGIKEKLNILADAAKYDVSCSSSGSQRQNKNNGLGNSSEWELVIPIPKMAVI